MDPHSDHAQLDGLPELLKTAGPATDGFGLDNVQVRPCGERQCVCVCVRACGKV